MEKEWKIKSSENHEVIQTLQDALQKMGKNYSPMVLRLLMNRGISSPEDVLNYFEFNYERDISDPFLFKDMEKAVERISVAKDNKEKICIFGDYDADGVTASVLLYEALRDLGFADVISYIPDRQFEGYGMNVEAVKHLEKEGAMLIITVDCGITNIEEVAKAKEVGIDVIITDHHHVPNDLPSALAIINPHMEDPDKGFRSLAGVGVAFKLVQALYRKMNPNEMEKLKWMLDIIAIGTIADCVPLLRENRVLVKYGLIVLSKTRRLGFQEMFKVGRILIDEDNIPDTQKVAFQISPRINAAGRMDHASMSYNLIIEKDRVKARELALEVEATNQERQKVTAEIVREVSVLAANSFKDKRLIFASNANWRAGILGLIAGKIADEFQKPTVILQKQEHEYVGSLRSIQQLNIVEELEKCSKLLIKFGGHSQAAGVRVAHENIEAFYRALSDSIENALAGQKLIPEIYVDMELKSEDINWDLMIEIKSMEPFGEGNMEPIFLAKDLVVDDIKIVGNGNKHLKLKLHSDEGGPKIFEAIGFGLGDKFSDLKSGDSVDIVFNLQEDEWNGNKKMQLKLADLKKAE